MSKDSFRQFKYCNENYTLDLLCIVCTYVKCYIFHIIIFLNFP